HYHRSAGGLPYRQSPALCAGHSQLLLLGSAPESIEVVVLPWLLLFGLRGGVQLGTRRKNGQALAVQLCEYGRRRAKLKAHLAYRLPLHSRGGRQCFNRRRYPRSMRLVGAVEDDGLVVLGERDGGHFFVADQAKAQAYAHRRAGLADDHGAGLVGSGFHDPPSAGGAALMKMVSWSAALGPRSSNGASPSSPSYADPSSHYSALNSPCLERTSFSSSMKFQPSSSLRGSRSFSASNTLARATVMPMLRSPCGLS